MDSAKSDGAAQTTRAGSVSADARPVHHQVGWLAAALMAMLLLVGAVGGVAVRSMRSDLGALIQRDGRLWIELTVAQQLVLDTQLKMERSATAPLDARLAVTPELEQQVRNVLAYASPVADGGDQPGMAALGAAAENWLAAAAVVLDDLGNAEPPDVTILQSEFDKLVAAFAEVITPLTQGLTDRADDATGRADLYLQTIIAVAALGLVISAIAGRNTFRATRAQHQEIERRHRERALEASTSRAHARIAQALEFAGTEADALEAVRLAVSELFPDRPTELMLADSSRAHFQVGLRANTDGEHGCPVSHPRGCPAIAKGQSLAFTDSERFESCAHLRGRPVGPIAALCVPVSIGGSAEGVLHSVGRQGELIDPNTRQLLEHIAARSGDRISSMRAFDRSETQAATDPLTGLANRRSFEEQVGTAIAKGANATLAFGDIDHFKVLNDTHGHAAGDRALRAFARVVRDTLRPSDVAARWGGEEFVIAFLDTDKVDATAILERLRASVAELGAGGTVPAFTISFGVADCDDGSDLESIVAAADRALLAAKRGGRDRVVIASADTASGDVDDRLHDAPALRSVGLPTA